jgi:biopolymer transport protein ExbD
MTPMVDVAFLLLIFFMSTTQFKPPEEISVQLPSSSSELKVPESGIIILTINKQGRIYIGDEKGRTAEVPSGMLAQAILQERSRRPAARMIVKGDRDVDFAVVSTVMKTLQETKTNRFNLMTELRTEG